MKICLRKKTNESFKSIKDYDDEDDIANYSAKHRLENIKEEVKETKSKLELKKEEIIKNLKEKLKDENLEDTEKNKKGKGNGNKQ